MKAFKCAWRWLKVNSNHMAHAVKRWYFRHVGLLSFLVVVLGLIPLVYLSYSVVFKVTEHLRIEARTDSVEIEFSQGQPIAWALGGAQLLECSQLTKVASHPKGRNIKKPQTPIADEIADEAEIELAAIEGPDRNRLSTVRARVSVDRNDLVVELEPWVIKPKDDATATMPGCSKDASPVAVLDTGNGIRRGLRLPAQLRLDGEKIRNGLTLVFRGGLRVGNDVTSSRQPLLMSGRLALWEARKPWLLGLHWLQGFAIPQFEVQSDELGLGDKVTIDPPLLGEASDDVPQGFVRIVTGVKHTEMSVYATTVATAATIVRPFRKPEHPNANWLKRLWGDELLTKLAALIATVALFCRLLLTHYYTVTGRAEASGPPNKNALDS